MTDTEQKRIKAICKVARIDDIGDLSDGYHTFRQLYYQRMMLFAALVKQNRGKAWKSLRHSDGELCFGGGWFIVGIDTPEGSYTYHYENKYFDLFDCEILDYGKHWDGHTEKDVTRLLSLEREPKTRWIPVSERPPKESGDYWCTFGGTNLTGIDHYTTESDTKQIFDEPEEYVGWRSQNVIAWMPLPKSYKAESEASERR